MFRVLNIWGDGIVMIAIISIMTNSDREELGDQFIEQYRTQYLDLRPRSPTYI